MELQETIILFFLQAGSISYRYMEFGKQISYHFFTNIAHFTTDFIKYNPVSFLNFLVIH